MNAFFLFIVVTTYGVRSICQCYSRTTFCCCDVMKQLPGTTQHNIRSDAKDDLQHNHHPNIKPIAVSHARKTEICDNFITGKRTLISGTPIHAWNVASSVFVDSADQRWCGLE